MRVEQKILKVLKQSNSLYYNDSDFFTFLAILTVAKQISPTPKNK